MYKKINKDKYKKIKRYKKYKRYGKKTGKKKLLKSIERNKKRIKFDKFLRLTLSLNKDIMHPWVVDKIKVKSMNLRKKIKNEKLSINEFDDYLNY